VEEGRNVRIVREFTRIFKNEHNVDGADHLIDTRNFVHHFRAQLPPGFEGLKQVGRMMNGAFPDLVVTEEDLISSGDRVVERTSLIGTHRGPMMGEKPTNKRVTWSEIFIYRLERGTIQEIWLELSQVELLQQIGVLPAHT
jgi:predicted ester cyclase